jgi:hypothetical protein
MADGVEKKRRLSFRQGWDLYGSMSIEASANGKLWSPSIVGLDKAAVDKQMKRLKEAGAIIARPAAKPGQKE